MQNTVKVSSFFALMAEFGSAEIPLKACHEKYFGIKTIYEANRKAAAQELPVPAYRCGTQASGWLINAADLAKLIDEKREQATKDHANIQAVTKAA